MKLKKLAEVTMWLPGFAPDDPLPMISHVVPSPQIIAVPLVAPIQITVPASNDDDEFVSPALIGETQPQRPPRVLWPSLDATVHSMLRGDVTKFDANLAAVSLLSCLEAENRPPTEDGTGPAEARIEGRRSVRRSTARWTGCGRTVFRQARTPLNNS